MGLELPKVPEGPCGRMGARRMVGVGKPDRRPLDRRTPTVVSRKTCYPGASFNSFGTYRLLAAGVKSANGEPKIDGGVLGSKAVVCREGGTLKKSSGANIPPYNRFKYVSCIMRRVHASVRR